MRDVRVCVRASIAVGWKGVHIVACVCVCVCWFVVRISIVRRLGVNRRPAHVLLLMLRVSWCYCVDAASGRLLVAVPVKRVNANNSGVEPALCEDCGRQLGRDSAR